MILSKPMLRSVLSGCLAAHRSPRGAVIQKEGTEEWVRYWVNNLWKAGGDVHASLEEQLRFLFKQGRREQTQNSQHPYTAAVNTIACTTTSRQLSCSISEEFEMRVENSPCSSTSLYTNLSSRLGVVLNLRIQVCWVR
jgi:hypothetical protein